jgi:hypothetical protein
MTSKATLFIAVAFVSCADAQVDRVMHFTSIQTIQVFQEIGTGVSKIADVQTTIDAPEKALMMHGTGDEIALAEWLFNDLDKPVIAGNDVVQVFYLSNTETMQRLQEVATTVRSIGDIKRSFTYNALRAVAVRGTPDQAALAEFLFTEIDKPGIEPGSSQQSRSSPTHIYRPDSREGVVRVFYLPNTKTVQNFQELVTTVRTVVNVRRLFTYNAPRAVVVRGTAEQIELADWLFNELDKPTNSKNADPPEYHLPTASDDVVRVFYLSDVQTVQRLQEIAVQAQSVTHQRAVLSYTAARAVIVRGTAAEIAQADRLIKERDR